MKDNSKYIAIGLGFLAIVVLIISLVSGNSDKQKDNFETLIVTNASNFYTVNSCLYRTITYLASEDKESLMLLISDDYKKRNKVKEENVLDLFFDVEENSTFVSEKMYYQTITSEITKYYVKGHIETEKIMDDVPLEKKNYESIYFIVYINSFDKLFSIEPYDGEIFIEGDANE